MTTAIKTKFFGPGNVRGARIKATTMASKSVSVTVGYDHRLSSEGNHIAAAKLLATKLEWRGQWQIGHTADGIVAVNAHNGAEFAFEIASELDEAHKRSNAIIANAMKG